MPETSRGCFRYSTNRRLGRESYSRMKAGEAISRKASRMKLARYHRRVGGERKWPNQGDSTAGRAAMTAIWCASMRRPPSISGSSPPALRTRCHCHAARARRLKVSSANAAATKIKVECRIGPPGSSAIRSSRNGSIRSRSPVFCNSALHAPSGTRRLPESGAAASAAAPAGLPRRLRRALDACQAGKIHTHSRAGKLNPSGGSGYPIGD